MVFNSLAFLLFLPVVFLVHWAPRSNRRQWQNTVAIIASYVFYGWWDVRFLSLIAFSSAVDFFVGLALFRARAERGMVRKALLGVSLVANLGVLGFFKYFGFFVSSFAQLLESFGLRPSLPTLNVILPVGISFYTFQTLSYTIDIYRKKIRPTRDPAAFFAFVSFFPQLVAGPIERAATLLPQFQRSRKFSPSLATDGLRQMLWGMTKKVVVADRLAPTVDQIFQDYSSLDGVILAWGAVLFAFQIYCDFSGYSDIAIGTARLFGIQLSTNFSYPYFSRSIIEFWRRWHISLSSWFRDYVYIPLGGSRVSDAERIRNVLVTFTVSGLWHGANWTFVVWGFLHGLYYLGYSLAQRGRVPQTPPPRRLLPTPAELLAIGTTFALVTLSWVFFRANSLTHAWGYIVRAVLQPIELGTIWHGKYVVDAYYVLPLVFIEWLQRHRTHPLDVGHLPVLLRWTIYLATAIAILEFGSFGETEFIYFQF